MKILRHLGLGLVISLLGLFIVAQSANSESLNRCIQFSGSNYAEASKRLITLDRDFTVEMWVYSNPSNEGKFAEFISQGAQPYAFYMGVDPKGFLRMGDIWTETGIKLKSNTWTHIALIFKAPSSLNLAINGKIVATKTIDRPAFNTAGTDTRFGAYYWPIPAEFFSGCLDEVRIWNVTRTESEINNYKDTSGISFPLDGLQYSYSFDSLTGYKNSMKVLSPDVVAKNQSSLINEATLQAKGGLLANTPRGNLISNDEIENCFLGPKTNSTSKLGNLPEVTKINGRDERQTSVDLDLNGLPDGACVGLDIFVKGTTEPLTSTVGIYLELAPSRNRMNLDTSAVGCAAGKSEVEARSWWSFGARFSQYGPAIKIPNCFGSIPTQGSKILAQHASISLLGEGNNQSAWAFQTTLRLKDSGLLPAATRTARLVSATVQEESGCHSLLKIAILQKISNSIWVDVGNFDNWIKGSNCSEGQPYQPIKKVSLPDTTVLRWKLSDGATWEVLSVPFIMSPGANGSKTDVSEKQPIDTAKSIQLETPRNFLASRVGNQLVIRVELPIGTRSKVDSVALIATGLGYSVSNPLIGSIDKVFGIFKIPQARISGKNTLETVFIESRGKNVLTSTRLKEEFDFSKFVVTPSAKPSPKVSPSQTKVITPKPTAKPTTEAKPSTVKPSATPNMSAIKCLKGQISRTFLATKCPPGWKIFK